MLFRSTYGTPTENGFCTTFCKVYDKASGKAVCGDGPWHKTGTDCTGCKVVASELLPLADRVPSSGLCAATESMSGIATWGTAIKECESSKNSCTVWQGLNGDSALNPERTCRGFCASFGLQCVNGYDDGDDGCIYGGEGIGCDSVLGCCSDGGPTPGKLKISPQQLMLINCHADLFLLLSLPLIFYNRSRLCLRRHCSSRPNPFADCATHRSTNQITYESAN